MRRILFSSDESDDDNHVGVGNRRKVYQIRRNFIKHNDFSFKEAFRISANQVEYVLQRIGPLIEKKNNRNKALNAKEQLLLCLHWLYLPPLAKHLPSTAPKKAANKTSFFSLMSFSSTNFFSRVSHLLLKDLLFIKELLFYYFNLIHDIGKLRTVNILQIAK